LRRARYQEGCLTRSKRKTGDVWEFRFRECQPDGTRKMRCVVVGPVARYRTRTAALHQIEVLRDATGHCTLGLHGVAREAAEKARVSELSLSLSRDGDYATALVVALCMRGNEPN